MLARWTLSALLALTSLAQASSCQNEREWDIPLGQALYCSATWSFHGNCNGEDMVYAWTLEGNRGVESWHIIPWESQAITIRGIELTVVEGAAPLWMMAGNGIIPDAMMFLGRGEYHGRHDFPPNTGMPMMSKGDKRSPTEYLDLHGACAMGQGAIGVLYTVYYTVP